MKLSIGQKVKFLNEVGGGIVSKIISPTMVNVTTEDGFDMPYLACDLIPAFSSDTVGKMFNANEDSYASIDRPDENTSEIEFERESALERFSSAKTRPFRYLLMFCTSRSGLVVKRRSGRVHREQHRPFNLI